MNEQIKSMAIEMLRKGVFKKNIHYIFSSKTPTEEVQEFEYCKTYGGSSGMVNWSMQKAYQRVGVQMQVSKEVSDDLLATDFTETSSISEIPFIAPVMEFYFEDPFLPTLLLMRAQVSDLKKWFPLLTIGIKDETLSAMLQMDHPEHGGTQFVVQLHPDMYQDFLLKADVPAMEIGPLQSLVTPLDESENACLAYMIHLALKVLVFASIPTFKPTPISRKQMIFGGKDGVCNRPKRPAFRTTYLPKVVYQSSVVVVSPSTERSIEFRGRRGHLRRYKSDVFVKRKGTWDFLPPIKDPHTGKYPERASIFKVRKS